MATPKSLYLPTFAELARTASAGKIAQSLLLQAIRSHFTRSLFLQLPIRADEIVSLESVEFVTVRERDAPIPKRDRLRYYHLSDKVCP